MGDPLEEALRLLGPIAGPLRRHDRDPATTAAAKAADAALRRAVEDPSTRARALVELGWLCRRTGRLEEAERRFDQAMETPEWRDAVRGKAGLLAMQARLPAAIEALRRGLARKADDAELNALPGTLLYYEKDLDGAERALEAAGTHAEAEPLLRMIRRERSRPPAPPSAPDPARLDRALERALGVLRAAPGTPEEKAAKEAALRDARRRRGSPS